VAIGQGEVSATPLQLANIECTIANHGYYYEPHLIKRIGDKEVIKPQFTVKHSVGIDQQYFEPVINGMQAVVDNGTGASSRITGITMCGKTGTAQVNGKANNSVFVAFAPRDHPKIAIAVVVENAGQGAWWAAPIASFIVEKYLRDSITTRPSGKTVESIINANLLPEVKQKPVKVEPGKAPAADSAKLKTGTKSAANNKKQQPKPETRSLAIQTKKDEEQ